MTIRVWGEYSSSSKYNDSKSKKGVSSAWIWAYSRSFAAFSSFGQFFAKWPDFLHTKQTFEFLPLYCFLLRNFHFFFLKIFFFDSTWYLFFKGYVLEWLFFYFLFFGKKITAFLITFNLQVFPFCSYPWASCEPFQFLKGIFYGCKAFLEQWACVDRSLLRRLGDHAKSFISRWLWESIEEGALDVYIIHAINRIKSSWHFVKVLF